MVEIENKIYFFLTKSVFRVASIDPTNSSSKFLLKSVMIRLLHKDKINPHIVFYPMDAVEDVKIEFGERYDGILQIGENMFSAEFNPKIRGSLNQRILSYATDMDGDIFEKDKIKIVCSDDEADKFFKSQIIDHNYPVEAISIDTALEEMAKIEEEFKQGNCYVENNIDTTEPTSQSTQATYSDYPNLNQ